MRTLALSAAILASSLVFAGDFSIQRAEAGWQLAVDGHAALTYHAPVDGPKPFIDPLLTPAGHSVTTTRSSQPQHHGLWFTWGGIRLLDTDEKVDFWLDAEGEVVPAAAPWAEVGEGFARITTENDWRRRSDGLVLLREHREVILHDSGTPRAHLLTITTEQRAVRPLVLLHESTEQVAYYGLALQTPADMQNGLVENRRKGIGRAQIEGVGSAWCAYATTVRPARGVAIFDGPTNPRHPNAWFTLPSGFLSTSLVAHDDWFMRPGDRLRLCYGVLVFDGDFDKPFISRMYDRWLALGPCVAG